MMLYRSSKLYYTRNNFSANTNKHKSIFYPIKVWHSIIKAQQTESDLNTVNVVIFAGGKFREHVGKTFHVGVIFTILLLFPS